MTPTSLPNQRNSFSDKQTKDWYIPTINYLISYATRLTNMSDVVRCLNAANGIIDDTTMQYVMGALSSDIKDKLKNLPPDIREIDIISPIKEKQIGEYIGLPYNYYVTMNNPDAIMDRDMRLTNAITEILSNKLIASLQASGLIGGNAPEPTPEDLEQFKKDFLNKWFRDQAIEAKRRLDVVNREVGFELLRVELFSDWWDSQRFYLSYEVVGNKVVAERIPVHEGYPIYNGSAEVENMDGFVRKRRITINDIVELYSKQLPKDELDYLYNIIDTGSNTDGNYYVPTILLQSRTINSKLRSASGRILFCDSSRTVDHYIVTFKTLREVKILTYVDLYGNINEMEVEPSYTLDKVNGDIDITNTYITEVWQGHRFGDEQVGVFIPPAPVAIQRRDDETGACKLPIGGRVGIISKSGVNPLTSRLLPYAALYRIYTYQQEITIAKYQRALKLIPQQIMNPDKNFSTAEKLMYMKLDDTIFYDNTEIEFNTIAQGTRVLLDEGVEKYIQGLEQLKQAVKAEAWEICGMNNPRMGLTEASAGKSVTEYNLRQAQSQSILMIYFFHKQLELEHTSMLEYSKHAWINGKESVVRNDKQQLIDINIDPIDHLYAKYGISVTNSMAEANKLADFKQLAFNASQNGELEIAAAAIKSDDRHEIEEQIEKFTKLNKAFQQDLETQRSEATKYAADKQIELEMAKLENVRYIAERQIEADLIKANYSSADVNFESDPLSDYNNVLKAATQQKKLELEERGLNHKISKDVADNNLKRERINADKYIARINK